MSWKFWKKKVTPAPKPEPVIPVPEPRCYVKAILKDLDDKVNWEAKYEGDSRFLSYSNKSPNQYRLHISNSGWYSGCYVYVSLEGLSSSEMQFTAHERELVGEKAAKLLKWMDEKLSQSKVEADEKKLKKLFPECYPRK